MEDLDKNEYEESLAKAETEDDKKNITLEYQVIIAFFIGPIVIPTSDWSNLLNTDLWLVQLARYWPPIGPGTGDEAPEKITRQHSLYRGIVQDQDADREDHARVYQEAADPNRRGVPGVSLHIGH